MVKAYLILTCPMWNMLSLNLGISWFGSYSLIFNFLIFFSLSLEIDLVPLCVTFICSLLLGVQYGTIIGICIDLVILQYPVARPSLKSLNSTIIPDEESPFLPKERSSPLIQVKYSRNWTLWWFPGYPSNMQSYKPGMVSVIRVIHSSISCSLQSMVAWHNAYHCITVHCTSP